MRMKFALAFSLVILSLYWTVAFAADVPPGKYELSVARVYESNPEKLEWVFIFGGTGRGGETVCKTVASLKKLLAGLPRGSTLDWNQTCRGEAVVLNDDLEDLKTICSKAGIVFTIHPSG